MDRILGRLFSYFFPERLCLSKGERMSVALIVPSALGLQDFSGESARKMGI